jgi:hypothetical protein
MEEEAMISADFCVAGVGAYVAKVGIRFAIKMRARLKLFHDATP